eukprot:3227085-Rhodomonas_salina.2
MEWDRACVPGNRACRRWKGTGHVYDETKRAVAQGPASAHAHEAKRSCYYDEDNTRHRKGDELGNPFPFIA